MKRVWKAWRRSDAYRFQEYREIHAKLPRVSQKEPQEEECLLAPSKLNLSACSFNALPMPKKTQEYEEALEYVARMHRSDAELQKMDRSTALPPSQG